MYTLPKTPAQVSHETTNKRWSQKYRTTAIVVEINDLFDYSPVEFKNRKHPGYAVAGAFALPGSIDER
jgi:hypothetical protein